MTPSNDQAQPTNDQAQPNYGRAQPSSDHELDGHRVQPGIKSGQRGPTERDVLDSLADLLGWPTADGIWDLSARDLGLRRPVENPVDLVRMVEHLMNIGDMIRVAGRSAKVRLLAHEELSRSVRQ